MKQTNKSGPAAWLSLLRILGILFEIATIIAGSWACSPRGDLEKTESIRLAPPTLESSALIYIAEDRRYFSDNGLDVTIGGYESGIAAMNALLEGKADMATMAEFVLVQNALQKKPVKIVGTMNRGLVMTVIGLKNRGISKLSDLNGKRIGLTRGSIPEFYLGRLLDLHGLNISQVVLVDLPPTKWLDAISSGDVDAIVGWPPYITQIQERFPKETFAWQAQSAQPLYGVFVARNDWIAEHPEAITRFWKSLAQAEEFLTRYPEAARAIVQTKLKYDDSYLEQVWAQYNFSLSLDQSLILAMEDEARWLISNNLTTETQVPNFLDYVYEDGLKTVKPEAVNIIR